MIDSHLLGEAADAAREKVDELIAQSGEHQEMVRQLEQQIDELEGEPTVLDDRPVPSGTRSQQSWNGTCAVSEGHAAGTVALSCKSG